MLKLAYPACFYPCEETQGYTVIIPDLPGCVSQGDNIADAFEMAVDCASGWILDELEDGNPIPNATNIKDVIPDEYENGFTSMIVLDMDSYAERYGNKAIRKNCTIPAWLNTMAEKEHINFSKILQDALISELNVKN